MRKQLVHVWLPQQPPAHVIYNTCQVWRMSKSLIDLNKCAFDFLFRL